MEIHYPFGPTPPEDTLFEVAPGIFWLRMVLPYALNHINLWLLRDGDGWVAVDTCLALDPARERWQQVLQDKRLTRIVATHFHPDHLGLAAWLQSQQADAPPPVLMSQGEFMAARLLHQQVAGYDLDAMLTHFRRHGLAEERLQALYTRGNAYARGVPSLPASYQRLIDGQTLFIDGREWQIIMGYGHSPEHASLYCPSQGVLISGDMLLPRITSNISVWSVTPDDDPLKHFLESIRRFNPLPAETLVLPAHGLPFQGIQTRVTQLENHHAERCEVLEAACRQSPQSSAALIPVLFNRDITDPHQTLFAMGEVIAHTNHLVHQGRLSRWESEGVLLHRAPARQD